MAKMLRNGGHMSVPQAPPRTLIVWLSPPPRDEKKLDKTALPAEWIHMYDRVAQVGCSAMCLPYGCSRPLCVVPYLDSTAVLVHLRGCRTCGSTGPRAQPCTWTSSNWH